MWSVATVLTGVLSFMLEETPTTGARAGGGRPQHAFSCAPACSPGRTPRRPAARAPPPPRRRPRLHRVPARRAPPPCRPQPRLEHQKRKALTALPRAPLSRRKGSRPARAAVRPPLRAALAASARRARPRALPDAFPPRADPAGAAAPGPSGGLGRVGALRGAATPLPRIPFPAATAATRSGGAPSPHSHSRHCYSIKTS